MKKNLCICIIISSLAFFSCKKEHPASSNNNADKVKTYTETVTSSSDSHSVTYNFTYDSRNRITSMFLVSAPSEKFVFTYNSDSEVSMDLLSSSGNIHEDIFFKNSLVDSTYQYNDTRDTTSEKYTYNGSSQQTKLYEYDYYNGNPVLSNTTNYTYDSNGNLVKTTDTENQVETFEYYPDLVYSMPVLSPTMTSQKTNLVKTHTVTSNGYPVDSVTNTYTFDGNNRISTITGSTSSGMVVTKTFTYF